jgi:hypothetical protein
MRSGCRDEVTWIPVVLERRERGRSSMVERQLILTSFIELSEVVLLMTWMIPCPAQPILENKRA